MSQNPSIFDFNEVSDDDESSDIVSIQLSSENIKINYYQLMKWSKLVREQYPKSDINKLSNDIQQYKQRYNMNEENIQSFFKSISDEKVQITIDQYLDYLKLSKIFKVSKFEQILKRYAQAHQKDIDFIIKVMKDQISYQNDNADENSILGQISPDMEELLSNNIDLCFKNQDFNKFPVSKVYRIIEKSDNQIPSDLLYEFIKKSINERCILFSFLVINNLSDQNFNDLCEALLNSEDPLTKSYSNYLKCDLSYIKDIRNERNQLNDKIEDLNNENEENKMNILNLKKKVKQLKSDKEILTTENEQLKSDKKNLKAENKQLKSDKKNLTTENEQLKNDKKNLTTENEQLKNDKKNLTTENEKLKSDKDNLTTKNEQLKSDKKNLTTENEQLKNDKKNLTTENEKLKSDKDNLTTKNEQLKSDKKNLTTENEKLKSDKKNLTTEYEQLKSDKKNLTTENEKLKSDKDNLTTENEQLKSDKDNLIKEKSKKKVFESNSSKSNGVSKIISTSTIRSNPSKSILNVAIIGHLHSGKSTLIGHLLSNLGCIDKREEQNYANDSSRYSFIMDKHAKERERGITIETSIVLFETSKYYFTAIDTPGHKDYVKNTINGIAKAKKALLVVDATAGKFEEGILECGQTREHALIALTLYVKQVIIVVNKMDDKSVNFSQRRFDEIKAEMTRILTNIGFKPDQCKFVPVSAFNGDNLIEKSPNLSWWTGGTLIEALDWFDEPKLPLDKPFRFSVCDVFNVSGTETVVVGIVQSGILKTGQDVVFPLSNIKAKVKSIEMFHKKINEATPYNIVGISVDAPSSSIFRGDVCGDAVQDPPSECIRFTGQMIIDHPGKIHAGYEPYLYCGTCHVPCKFEKLLHRIDRRHGKKVTENPEWIQKDDAAVVILKPSKPIIAETFKENPSLGCFVIRDMKQTVAVGVFRSVEKKA